MILAIANDVTNSLTWLGSTCLLTPAVNGGRLTSPARYRCGDDHGKFEDI